MAVGGGGSATIIEQVFKDPVSAAAALAIAVADQLRYGIAQRGKATLVVSGGRSPLGFFASLRTQVLDWSQVSITLADERWVDLSHPDSNERLLREYLMQDAAAAARLVGLKNGASTPAAGCTEARLSVLATFARPFDAVVLGMGTDGHTASLFPGMPGLAAALQLQAPADIVAGVAPVAPTARISLNLSALLDARCVYLPLQGKVKRAIYESARVEPNPLRHPVSALFHQQGVPVTVQLIDD